jgi:hypothetical protein
MGVNDDADVVVAENDGKRYADLLMVCTMHSYHHRPSRHARGLQSVIRHRFQLPRTQTQLQSLSEYMQLCH